MSDHCRRQLHTFHPGPTAAQVVAVCPECQAETHSGDVLPEHTLACPAVNIGGPCEWFALCDRPATGTTPHPVLGNVPTCDRCNAFATA